MRTNKQFKRDSYILNLLKMASVFTMMAYSLSNKMMMETFGPGLVLIPIIFMFIPREYIYKLLDNCKKGKRRIKPLSPKRIKFNLILDTIKFNCLVFFVLYTFINTEMVELLGMPFIAILCLFMVIPRKLITMIAFSKYDSRPLS